MGTGIRDASLTTSRRKQVVLWGARLARGGYYKEQGTSLGMYSNGPSMQVNMDVKAGAALAGRTNGNCACSGPIDLTKFDRRSPANGSCC